MSKPRFTFTVEAQSDEVPPIHRLRSWLKIGLRVFRLKAVAGFEELPPPRSPDDAQGTQTPPDDGTGQ